MWEWLWTPPSGIAVQGQWFLDDNGLPEAFTGTALYVLVSLVLGLLAGVAVGALARRREAVVLLAAVIGSVLAAWLMLRVGHAVGPPDPVSVAKEVADHTAVVGDLRVTGTSPYLAWPMAVVVGMLMGLLLFDRRQRGASAD